MPETDMKIAQIFRNLLLIVIMIGCDDKEEINTPIMEFYPMTVGTEWVYNRQQIIKQYESESSDKVIGTDTINFSVRVWIDRDTILNDTMYVKVFKSYEDGNNWTYDHYKFVDDDGLRNYAYSNVWGPHVFAHKNRHPLVPLLKSSRLNQGVSFNFDNDSIIVEDQPTLDIQFPLSGSSYWTYRYPTKYNALQINKEVVGTDYLKIAGQEFACFMVNWNYLFDPSFNYFTITDWISAKGLVQRWIVFDRMTYTTHGGEEYVGDFQVTEILTLVELKIK